MLITYYVDMRRVDIYLKVELELDDKEPPERIAREVSRVAAKVYGVRKTEVSSIIDRDAEAS
jgi:hypothetical protein